MARSSSSRTLTEVFLSVPKGLEEALLPVFESAYGGCASVYYNFDTGHTQMSVYLEVPPAELVSRNALFQSNVERYYPDLLSTFTPAPSHRLVKKEDWAESWKKHFKPLRVGKRLLVRGSWHRVKIPPGAVEVVLDPGLSFGTGQHATTSFCLRELVKAPHPKESSFLDIGTGSGILAIAAQKLGFKPVHAFDFDPDAVRVARANARFNKAAAIKITQADLTRLPLHSGRKYDLVCANLIYDLLLQEKSKILARVQPAGLLVLAGILTTQFAEVEKSYQLSGWDLVRSRTEKEWTSGAFQAISRGKTKRV